MYCPNCGKENPEETLFCSECGTSLKSQKSEISSTSDVEKKSTKKPAKKKKKSALGCGAVLIIGLIVLVVVIMTTDTSDKEDNFNNTAVTDESKTEAKKTSNNNTSENDDKTVYNGKNFAVTFEGVKTDNELLGMSGASSNLFGIVVTIQNLSDKTMTYTLEDIYVDDTYAGISGAANTSTPVTLAPGKTYHGHFSGAYGNPGDIKSAIKLEFKVIGSDEKWNKIEESPVITVSLK